jgi:hypothetical protein
MAIQVPNPAQARSKPATKPARKARIFPKIPFISHLL